MEHKAKMLAVFLALVFSAFPLSAFGAESAAECRALGGRFKDGSKLSPKERADMGLCYQLGRGVPQDYAEAVKHYRAALKGGFQRAGLYLGHMLATGKGVPEDRPAAMALYIALAERGDADGQFPLGMHIATDAAAGYGDPLEAHMWLNLASSGDLPEPLRRIARRSISRLEGRMTPAQIAEAQRRAREWKPKK
ncbi:MAG: sel1 repeat family protein [Candidatus Tectomicrobia bacterium]|nr:sel1 repeat family protein [Candidatus Tectomicrobia bacterium]